jgi:hypothetical protein
MSYKYAVHLNEGWNFVSFFITNISLDLFIQNKNIIEIKTLKHSYHRDFHITNLKEITIYTAYWINSEKETLVDIEGTLNKSDITINVSKGWNMVGYPYKFTSNISTLIQNTNISQIKYNNFSYNSLLPSSLNTLKNFESNYGYWFYIENAGEIEFKYPFIYNKVNEDTTINGLILLDDFRSDELKNNFLKKNYKIETTSKTQIEIPNGVKNISLIDLNNILNKLNDTIFSVYYGYLKGTSQSIGINFYNKFFVLSEFIGNIKIQPKTFDNNTQLIECYFNNSNKDRILFNITNNTVVIGLDGNNVYINNVLFKEYKLTEEININKSLYLSDYSLEELQVNTVNIQKNDNLLIINEVTTKYDIINMILKVYVYTSDGLIILSLKNTKTVNKTTIVEINNTNDSKEYLILQNQLFHINVNNTDYTVNMTWEGNEYYNKQFDSYNYNKNNMYLYWYSLNNIILNSVLIDSINVVDTLNILDSGNDYLIFEVYQSQIFYRIYLIKNKSYKGIINITIYSKTNINDDFNLENKKHKTWAIHESNPLNIEGIILELKWTGDIINLGYSLKSTKIEKQRDIGLKLNTYEIISFPNISFKIHYSIGSTDDSINLTFWKSYKNFITSIKTHLSYLIEYINYIDIQLPFEDVDFYKNGGDNNYDIYITNIDNKNINGYTQVIDYNYKTSNQNDVVTFINIGCNLDDYELLKVVLYREFFNSIQGSYDWFDKLWISKGLATAFEYNLSNSQLSTKYLSLLFSNKNLALSYNSNFKIESGYITLFQELPINYMNGMISIEIVELYSNDKKIEIDETIIGNIYLSNKNNGSINIKKSEIRVVNNKNHLFILFDSNRTSIELKFSMTIKSYIITEIIDAYSTRYNASFAFFQYLFEKFGTKNIINNILTNTSLYNSYALIEYALNRINPNLSFIEELTNFWCAVTIMKDDNSVEENYKLVNAKKWIKYNNTNNQILSVENTRNSIVIDNLEYAGCSIIDIIYKSENSGTFKISGNFNINYIKIRAVVEYQNNVFQVMNIKPEQYFTIDINSTVYKIKLLLVTDVLYPSYEPITLETVTTSNFNTYVIDKQLFKFAIKINPSTN